MYRCVCMPVAIWAQGSSSSLHQCFKHHVMAACPYIESLEWDASVALVCRHWWRFAQNSDPNFIQEHHCTDVHEYVALKCRHIVSTKHEFRQAGLAFYNHDLSWYVPCLVWADDEKESQTTPYVTGAWEPGEQWFPCICLNIAPNADGLLPFYCPSLTWPSNARSWWVHVSRVRRLVGSAPPPAPPHACGQQVWGQVVFTSPPSPVHSKAESSEAESSIMSSWSFTDCSIDSCGRWVE